MSTLSNIILFLALVAAVLFSLLVLLTGKGDAMSGGGSIRTTYKGKATFDDVMSKSALYLGFLFLGLVLVYSVLAKRMELAGMIPKSKSSVSAPAAANNAPAAANNAPAAANNAPAAANNAPAAANNAPAAANSAAPTASNNAPAANNAPAN